MTIHPLRADYGDALVININEYEQKVCVVIDGGPESTEESVANYYHSLDFIDLLILTHYDEDHITGLLKYFSELKGDELKIGAIWANCARLVDFDREENTSCYDNAFKLADCLSKLHEKGIIGEWRDDITTNTPSIEIKGVKIDILSPTPKCLSELKNKYQQYIEDNGLKDDPDTDEEVAYKSVLDSCNKTLDVLASQFKKTSTTFMNKTSIAIRLRGEDKTLLFLGDADSSVICYSLEQLGATMDNPMHIDLMKVSHHGSKSNICEKLFKIIDCKNYLFTTSGGDGGAYHPDRMTLACLLKWCNEKSDDKLNLFFNYPLSHIMARNTGLLKDEEKSLFNITDNYPTPIPTITL